MALSAAVLPHRRRRAARLAPIGPVERVAELQGAAILLERLPRLAAALEDGAEQRVDRGRAGRSDFDLLELIGGLVEHLQLEEDTAESRPIQGDHPARAALLAIGALEPREEWKRRQGFGGAFPGADRLAMVSG